MLPCLLVNYPLTSRPLSTKIPQIHSLQHKGQFLLYLQCLLLHTDFHNLCIHKGGVSQRVSTRNTITQHARGKETSSNACNAAEARRGCSWGLTLGAEGRSPSPLSVFDGDAAARMELDLERYCWSSPPVLHSVRWGRSTYGPQKLEELFLRWCFTVLSL